MKPFSIVDIEPLPVPQTPLQVRLLLTPEDDCRALMSCRYIHTVDPFVRGSGSQEVVVLDECIQRSVI